MKQVMPTFIDDDVKTFAAFEGEYLKEGNRVNGVSLIQKGPAIGHGVWVDDTTLFQLQNCCTAAARVRAKTDHFTGIAETIGYFENFRIAGGKVLGDLVFYSTSASAPLMREMIETVPKTFGVSIAFLPEKTEYNKVEDKYFARIKDILSADFVDNPAANAGGVFSKGTEVDNTEKHKMEEQLKARIAELEKLSAEQQEQLTAATQCANDLQAKVAGFESKPSDDDEKVAKLEAQLAELATRVKALAAAPEPKNNDPLPPNNNETTEPLLKSRGEFEALSFSERNAFFKAGGKLK